MSDVRCRACGAVVTPNAAWCSLCYADLRHPVEAASVSSPSAARASSSATAAAAREQIPLAATAAAAIRATVVAATADVLDAATPLPTEADVPVAVPSWPCPRCGAKVSMDLDACNSCGAGFLSGAASASAIRLPVVGDVNKMSSGQRLTLALMIAVGVTLVLVLLAELGGRFL